MSDSEDHDARLVSNDDLLVGNDIGANGSLGEGDDLDDDLFGDGGDEEQEAASPERRKLDDEDLDSGDDEGRRDRFVDDDEGQAQEEEQQLSVMDAALDRHGIPQPSDKELYLLRVPRFLGIQSKEFSLPTFQPPTTDHHNKGAPSATFSAYNTAMTTVRWRHSPSKPAELQSNGRILRWSDGSLTLQLASDPKIQYEIESKPLAPPQRNPTKPTPTSLREFGKKRQAAGTGYNVAQDSFTYLVSPHEAVQMLRVTNKITTGLNVLPTADTADDALERLQNSLAKAAARGREDEPESGALLVNLNEDPELAKRRAEAAEREKLRQQRAREKHEMRDRDRAGRGFGRSAATRPGGLTIGALEDDDGGRKARPKPRKARRHEDWSDEEDYNRGGARNREDEYDEEDDFIAGSDEEEEVADDDDDLEEEILDEPRHRNRGRDQDSGDDEDEMSANVSRVKRRRVVDEDDDDE